MKPNFYNPEVTVLAQRAWLCKIFDVYEKKFAVFTTE
jgi:hypothetical protein